MHVLSTLSAVKWMLILLGPFQTKMTDFPKLSYTFKLAQSVALPFRLPEV